MNRFRPTTAQLQQWLIGLALVLLIDLLLTQELMNPVRADTRLAENYLPMVDDGITMPLTSSVLKILCQVKYCHAPIQLGLVGQGEG